MSFPSGSNLCLSLAIAQRRAAGGEPVTLPPHLRGVISGPSEIIAGTYTVAEPPKPIAKSKRAAAIAAARTAERQARTRFSLATAKRADRPVMPPDPAPPTHPAPDRIPWESLSCAPVARTAPDPITWSLALSGPSPSMTSLKTGLPVELGPSAFYVEKRGEFQKNGKPKLSKIRLFRAEIVGSNGQTLRRFCFTRRTSEDSLAVALAEIARACGQPAADDYAAGCLDILAGE